MPTLHQLPPSKGFDQRTGGQAAAWWQAAKAAGYQWAALDLYANTLAQDVTQALAAGLGVMLFQGYYAPAWAEPEEAARRADEAVAVAREVGYPAGATLWLDCEDMAIDREAAMTWITTWAATVKAAGYGPGVYVGANCPLSGEDWWSLPDVMHYWRSASEVPEVANRGYQIIQEALDVALDGHAVDDDTVLRDRLGGLPNGMVADPLTTALNAPTTHLATPRQVYRVVVLPGVTVHQLASQFGTSPEAILQYNHCQTVVPGMLLDIPVG